MLTDIEPWYIKYFWHGLAIFLSPLLGYFVTEWYKALTQRKQRKVEIRAFAALVTFIFCLLLWWKATRDWEGAIILAACIGIAQPWIVLIYCKQLKKREVKMLNMHDNKTRFSLDDDITEPKNDTYTD